MTIGSHLCGNVEGFMNAATREMWLVTRSSHGTFALQRRVFDCFVIRGGSGLEKVLMQPSPNAKTPISTVVLTHLEGGPWNFVELDRYNSWQDLATDAAASVDDPGWTSVRDHSASITTRSPIASCPSEAGGSSSL